MSYLPKKIYFLKRESPEILVKITIYLQKYY